MQDIIFPMSDNWWLEGNKAYFCGIEINAIFCVDMTTGQCDVEAVFPEIKDKIFRVNPYCIKHKDVIFCLPCQGKYIWFYNLKLAVWEKIEVRHKEPLLWCNKVTYRVSDAITWLWEYDEDTARIYKINLEKKILEKEYYIPVKGCIDHSGYSEYVFVHGKLYCVVGKTIHCIDINHDKTIIYEMPDAKAELYTICYDGLNFWLSSYCKEIYVWNPEQGIIKTITEFPKQFGFYHFHTNEEPYIDWDSYYSMEQPFFLESVMLGRYIWYISSQSDSIVYINKQTYEVNLLSFERERETKESLQREFICKYIIEYIREERYIGLYSVKNQFLFEIDIFELSVEEKHYELTGDAILSLVEAYGCYDGHRNLREGKKGDIVLFSAMLKSDMKNIGDSSMDIGALIYRTLNL